MKGFWCAPILATIDGDMIGLHRACFAATITAALAGTLIDKRQIYGAMIVIDVADKMKLINKNQILPE